MVPFVFVCLRLCASPWLYIDCTQFGKRFHLFFMFLSVFFALFGLHFLRLYFSLLGIVEICGYSKQTLHLYMENIC